MGNNHVYSHHFYHAKFHIYMPFFKNCVNPSIFRVYSQHFLMSIFASTDPILGITQIPQLLVCISLWILQPYHLILFLKKKLWESLYWVGEPSRIFTHFFCLFPHLDAFFRNGANSSIFCVCISLWFNRPEHP